MRLLIYCGSGSVLSLPLRRRAIAPRAAAAALAIFTLLIAASPAPAAPIRGSVDRDGFVRFSGLTGEIFIAIRGPEEIILPVNQLPLPGQWYVPDYGLPGEVGYLGLSGLNGTIDAGYVVERTASPSQLSQLRMAFQSTFTSDLVEVPLQLTPTPTPLPDPNSPSFVYLIPEPATGSIAALGVGAIVVRRSRVKCGSR